MEDRMARARLMAGREISSGRGSWKTRLGRLGRGSDPRVWLAGLKFTRVADAARAGDVRADSDYRRPTKMAQLRDGS